MNCWTLLILCVTITLGSAYLIAPGSTEVVQRGVKEDKINEMPESDKRIKRWGFFTDMASAVTFDGAKVGQDLGKTVGGAVGGKVGEDVGGEVGKSVGSIFSIGSVTPASN